MKRYLIRVVAHVAYHLRLWRLVLKLYQVFGRKSMLAVFMFHRITSSDRTTKFLVPYDIGLDRRLFEEQLAVIGQHFDIIGLDQFAEVVRGRLALKRHSALLTFDDADSEFPETVLPLLLRKGWPGVIFAPTAFVGTEKRVWHLRVSNAVMQFDGKTWSTMTGRATTMPAYVEEIVARYPTLDQASRPKICRDLIDALDRRSDEEVTTVIGTLEMIAGTTDVLGIKCMDWVQLRQMIDSGVVVESHTVNHLKLERLPADSIMTELETSKTQLESALGRPIKAICYPQGSFNDQVTSLAAHVGYEIGFTTEAGVCRYPLQAEQMFRIPRVSTGNYDKYDLSLALGRLAVERILLR